MKYKEDFYSVTEFNNSVKTLLESSIGVIRIQGEVSNLSRPRSGHIYFSLKDEDSQVRCAMFKNSVMKSKIDLNDGMLITVDAAVSLYTARGDFQLIIHKLIASGDGVLQLRYQQLVAKLTAEGWFSEKHKKPIPSLTSIQTVGVVTSLTGAALHDIISILKRRSAGIKVLIYPSLVQGKDAAISVANSIQQACSHDVADVLIVGRGGGSLEDLWAFNEMPVIEAIFNSSIPIISAVGHEVDFTISDLVADIRAATPSAAAELVTPDIQHIKKQLHDIFSSLNNAIKLTITNKEAKINLLKLKLISPETKLDSMHSKLKLLIQRMTALYKENVNKKEYHFANLLAKLEALSPLAVLSRGYAAIQDRDNKFITEHNRLKVGDNITLITEKIKILCQILDTMENNDSKY